VPQVKTAPRQQTTVNAKRPKAPSFLSRSPLGSRQAGLASFLRDLRSEIRKVIWPSRREWTNLTLVVLAISAAVGAFLGVMDFIFQEFFRLLLRLAGQGI
jgi:preprotein translocase subunit SecE